MDRQAYFKALYDLADRPTRFGKFKELDFSNDAHRECVTLLFGGKDSLERDFTRMHTLITKASASTKLFASDDHDIGLMDTACIFDPHMDASNTMKSAGSVTLVGDSPKKIFVSIVIYRNGERIANKEQYAYSQHYAEIEADVNNFITGNNGELKVVLHATWSEEGSDVVRSLIATNLNAEGSFSLSQIIDGITVVDPKQTSSRPHDSIVAVYGRIPTDGIYDYYYLEGRDDDYQQLLYLDTQGSVKLISGMEFIGIDPELTSLLLDNTEKGGLWYRNRITQDCFTKTNDGFSWNFDNDWKNSITREAAATGGRRGYDYSLHIRFEAKYQNKENEYEVTISSFPNDNNSPNHQQILPITLQWGCLAEGTLIAMADESKKAINEIVIGEYVKTVGGKSAKVVDVLRGTDSLLYTVETISGKIIRLTYNHALLTDIGFMDANELLSSKKYKIITEDGSKEDMLHCYESNYDGKVYNLTLESELHVMFANGIAVGDNVVQNREREVKSFSITDEALLEKRKFEDLWK
jgi:hypothetical protein